MIRMSGNNVVTRARMALQVLLFELIHKQDKRAWCRMQMRTFRKPQEGTIIFSSGVIC